MKPIIITLLCNFFVANLCAQEKIKVGETQTLACTGSFVAQVQNYFSDGKPSSKSRTFVDAQKDSLIIFTALIDDNRDAQKVYRYAVGKKDIDQGDWGFTVEAAKENGASFFILKINTVEGNSVISEQYYKNDEIENNEPTNRVFIYFDANKETDAKTWAAKIKKMIQ